MRDRLIVAGLLLGALAATPVRAQVQDVVKGAEAPLQDLRITEKKIPDILLLAASAPYSTQGTQNCAAIRAQIEALNGVLGVDADGPQGKKGDATAIAAAASRSAAGALIPGFGVVRMVTGADKQQKRVEAAFYGGGVRRAFLKGMGLAKGCPVPASPTVSARSAVPGLPAKED